MTVRRPNPPPRGGGGDERPLPLAAAWNRHRRFPQGTPARPRRGLGEVVEGGRRRPRRLAIGQPTNTGAWPLPPSTALRRSPSPSRGRIASHRFHVACRL